MTRAITNLVAFLALIGISAISGSVESRENRHFVSPVSDVPHYLSRIDFPAWTKHGVQLDTTLTLPNLGSTPLDYVITAEEDTGPAGWLAFSGGTGHIPVGGTEDITLHLNNGGIVNSPGTVVTLVGRLIFTHNQPSSPDTFSIRLWVRDTLISPALDTISTSSIALVYTSNGDAGQMGMGGVNMDYTSSGQECDSSANVYLYDSSPLVGRENDGNAIFYSSFYGHSFLDSAGLVPLAYPSQCLHLSTYSIANSGTFLTHDSSVAISRILVASNDPADGDFLIQCLRIRSNDGLPHTGLTIAEAIDWDIPSDSAEANSGGFDESRNLVYQRGLELNRPAQDSVECQQNDARFGGLAFLGSYLNGASYKTAPYSAYVEQNDQFLYALSNFDPQQLWNEVHNSGFHATDSVEDLHTVMCYEPDFTLQPGDVLDIFSALVVLRDGNLNDYLATVDRARDLFSTAHIAGMLTDSDQNGLIDVCEPWYCCTLRGDVNASGQFDMTDIICLSDYMFCILPGGEPCCSPACDGNADFDASGSVDIGDLVAMVDWAFSGEVPPLPCY